MQKVVERMIIKTCILNSSICLFVLSAIMWLSLIIKSSEYIMEYSSSFLLILWYSILLLPKVIPDLIPYCLFVGFWISFINLENQLYTMRSSGVSLRKIYAIFCIAILPFFVLSEMFEHFISPINKTSVSNFRANITTKSVIKFIKEQKITKYQNADLYVDKVEKEGNVLKTIIIRNKDKNKNSSILSSSGGSLAVNENGRISINLVDSNLVIEDDKNQKTFIKAKKAHISNNIDFTEDTRVGYHYSHQNTFELLQLFFKDAKKLLNNENLKWTLLSRLYVPFFSLLFPALLILTLIKRPFSRIHKALSKTNIFCVTFMIYLSISLNVVFSFSSKQMLLYLFPNIILIFVYILITVFRIG